MSLLLPEWENNMFPMGQFIAAASFQLHSLTYCTIIAGGNICFKTEVAKNDTAIDIELLGRLVMTKCPPVVCLYNFFVIIKLSYLTLSRYGWPTIHQ